MHSMARMVAVLEMEHPLAAAHRGSRVLWPENTMVAFQGAVDLGYRFLETDLHLTSDGVLVTFHDDTLDRCTNAEGPIAERSFADLREIDAGYRFELAGSHPFRGAGIGIPALAEVMGAFPDVCLILDLKQPGLEEPLARFLAGNGMQERVIVGSFSDRRLRAFRGLVGGRVATSAGPREVLGARARSWMRQPAQSMADVFQVPVRHGIRLVDRAFVEAAHEAGKHVHVWTVNERSEMERLLDLGVDGLITDRPDTLREVMTARGGGPW